MLFLLLGCRGCAVDWPSDCDPAEELCNGADDDCDGEIDEDPSDGDTLWVDEDGDEWGGATSVVGCEGTSGLTNWEGDCDDADPAAHPHAEESCDAGDQDCDGEVDEVRSWRDADGDGWGNHNLEHDGCPIPDGFVARSEDCDDGDATIHPDAEEVYYDGVDQDCDGRSDNDADRDGDDAVAFGGLDCEDENDEINWDAGERCDNDLDDNCDGRLDDCTEATWFGAFFAEKDTEAGAWLDLANVDAPELVIGSRTGEAWVVSADVEGDVYAASALARITDLQGVPSWNPAVVLGDADGDGLDDVLMDQGGGVRLHLGPLRGLVGPEDAAVTLDTTGAIGLAGDVDGDGRADALVGDVDECPVAVLPGTLDGAAIACLDQVHVIGSTAADVDGDGLSDLVTTASDVRVYLSPVGEVDAVIDQFTNEIPALGDLDGDGHADVALGLPYEGGSPPNSGQVAVLRGPLLPISTTADAALLLAGERDDAFAGYSAHILAGSEEGSLLVDGGCSAYEGDGVCAYRVPGATTGTGLLGATGQRVPLPGIRHTPSFLVHGDVLYVGEYWNDHAIVGTLPPW